MIEHSENVLKSGSCLDSQRSVEDELVVSCRRFLIAFSPRIVVVLLLGMFYPAVYEFE
jgi:hypothetical protein